MPCNYNTFAAGQRKGEPGHIHHRPATWPLEIFMRGMNPKSLLLLCVAFGAIAEAADISMGGPPTSQPVYPIAMCSNGNLFNDKNYPPAILDAGATMVRIDAAFIATRPRPEEDPNKWDWSEFEKIRRMRAEYPKLEIEPILGYSAKWASEPNGPADAAPIAGKPRGLNVMPPTDPRNLYGQYVYEAVRRYKDVIHTWESWNEPDLPGHAFFAGNGTDFFLVQKSCYLSAKAADPNCQVLFAGMCYANVEGYLNVHHLSPPSISPPADCFFEQYLKECVKDPDARANHYYFDIMNQHSYSRASDLYDYVAVDRKLMSDYLGDEGKQKPIWITEMGLADHGGMFGGTSDEYCDYLLQSFAWGELAGVQRFFHFQLDDSNSHGLYYQVPAKPKPALVTYRDVLAKELGNISSITQIHGHAGVGMLEGNSPYKPVWQSGYDAFEMTADSGHRHVLLAFADTDKAISVKLPAKSAHGTLIDRHNHRTPIDAKNGFYEVTLEGATNIGGWPTINDPRGKAMGQPEHLVGGATIVIVEEATQP
jgi:hypothetical protein